MLRLAPKSSHYWGVGPTDIKRFDSPESEPYDRYVIKLHTKASALLQEHSDILGALVEAGQVELEIQSTERRPAAVYRAVAA